MPRRGEVWLVDLGLAQQIRPALILITAYSDADRALITVISTHDKDSWLEIRAAGLRAVSQARRICCAKRYHNSSETCVAATRRTLS
jgi:mRNA-degrading endonuclease toxin of MazEF toxin-antitoxin module